MSSKVPTLSAFNRDLNRLSLILDKYQIQRDDLLDLLLAMKYDRLYGAIPNKTHLKLVELYFRSSGEVQDVIHSFRLRPALDNYRDLQLTSDLFTLSSSQFTSIIHDLSNDGYAQLPCLLSSKLCSDLLRSSEFFNYSCLQRIDDCLTRYLSYGIPKDCSNLIATFALKDSLNRCSHIKDIVSDPVILSIVSHYLRCSAQLKGLSFWHSFPTITAQPETEAAQLFHYDLDEFRWLKLFVFLTDVNLNTGPHVYIPGTHKTGSKPKELLEFGYARIPDHVMEKFFSRHTWRSIVCSAGTIVIADTRCYHKGTALIEGTRSLLSPEFAPSTFSQSFLPQ